MIYLSAIAAAALVAAIIWAALYVLAAYFALRVPGYSAPSEVGVIVPLYCAVMTIISVITGTAATVMIAKAVFVAIGVILPGIAVFELAVMIFKHLRFHNTLNT